jgi:hypothetical protein
VIAHRVHGFLRVVELEMMGAASSAFKACCDVREVRKDNQTEADWMR